MASFPTFGADFSAEAWDRHLSRFFARGAVDDLRVAEATGRLHEVYRRYLDLYTCGLWAPGLVVTPEMRRLTEMLMPLDDIHAVMHAFCRASHDFPVHHRLPLFQGAFCWLDLLPLLPKDLRMVDPARLLRRAACHEKTRLELLFSLHLPRHHGGRFGRYPRQYSFIRQWLAVHFPPSGILRCLDTACGTGEGTYELAMLLSEKGAAKGLWQVHGVSQDPLEIFAAAHARFPHDQERETALRRNASSLADGGFLPNVAFDVGDILGHDNGKYDLILCNGILGGPFLHGPEDVRKAVATLAGRLAPGGLLLAADRFHEGWGRKTGREWLNQLLVETGLTLVEPGEGVGGTKNGSR